MTIALLRLRVPVLVVGFAVALGGVVARGQRPPGGGGAPAGGPVAVDFTVVGANGQVVPDLKAADVSIKVAGKARTISSLELKRLDAGAGPTTSVAPPYATNTPSNGRSILIVVDAESLRVGTERAIRENLEGLFKGLSSTDRVAFSIAPRDTAQVRFGAGLAAVRDAVGKLAGLQPATVTDSDKICRTRDTLLMLRSAIDALAGNETPTSVVFIASGLAVETRAVAGAGVAQCEVTRDNYQALSAASANARVNMYVVQGDESVTGRDDGLESLVGVTNAGAVIRMAGGGLSRVLTESSAYYVASLEADPADKAGVVQRLEVKVNRDGVTTRSRTDVALGRAGAGRGAAAQKVSPRDMLRTAAGFTDLQLRATAFVSRGQADKMTVFVLSEAIDPAAKIAGLMVGLVDPAGSLKFQSTADDKQLSSKSVAVFLAAPVGKYRLRVAAVDAAGRSGAVDYDLNADLTPAGTLKLGSILLVAPRGESYAPQLQFADDEIAMQLEIYGELTGQVSAKVEVAATADGPALVTVQPGGQGTSEPDKFILSGKIPIDKLALGDYVVRAIVQLEGQPEGRVFRTLRKVAK